MLISTPFPPEEGIGNYVYNLSNKLIEKGHKVTVITRGSWKKIQKENIDGIKTIKVIYIPIYPFYILIHGLFVNKIFKSIESQIDIVHVHSPLPPLIKTKLPMIMSIHTPMLTDAHFTKISSVYSLFSKISARLISYPLELKLVQASDIITTISRTIAQELKDYYNLNEGELTVIGNGTDEKFFYPQQKKSENGKKYIMYVGHVDREKGLFDLVEAGRLICRKNNDITFIVAGKGRDLNKLKRKIRKLKLHNRFRFLGQVSKNRLVKLYQNADLFVLPSYHEGIPTVLLEAMSCGTPVIATDVRGNRDIISSGENGILVPPRAPKKLAETILYLIEDKKLRERIGKNARKTIEEKYTWNTISDMILERYKLLTGITS